LVIPYLDVSLAHLPQRPPQFFTVVEAAEKPGNVGAILRTADAAGVHGVILCGGADLHNPNVVRASLGALFTVPVAEASSAETLAWLRSQGVQIVAATPDATLRYTDIDYTRPTAMVMGSEAFGLSRTWLDAAAALVYIPMHGDSLNLSASTAILLYEVLRQRSGRP
jgi:TrmH family RNA methyltransferase